MAIDLKTWQTLVKTYDEPEHKGVRALFFGVGGSGKTHLLGTAPEKELFMFDIDHGGETIASMGCRGIPYITLPQERGLMGFARKVLLDFKDRQGKFAKGAPWESRRILGFDGYSNLVDLVLWELCQLPGSEKTSDGGANARFKELSGTYKPERDHWQALRAYLFEITQIIEDISYRGYDVLATAGEFVKENDDLKKIQGLPEIQGGFKDVIGRKFDMVIRLKVENGKYFAMTVPEGPYIAKVRRKMPAMIENPSYETLFKG